MKTQYTKVCRMWLKQYIIEMYCFNEPVILKIGLRPSRNLKEMPFFNSSPKTY